MITWLLVRSSLDVASAKVMPVDVIEIGVNGNVDGLIFTAPPEPMLTAPIMRLNVVDPPLPAKLTAPLTARFALVASAPLTLSVPPALVVMLVLAIAPAPATVRLPAVTTVGPV